MTKNTYSQANQDIFVSSVIGHNGNYIELGARRAIAHNNTYLLETEYNWKGISVEFDRRFEKDWLLSGRKNPIEWSNALTLNYKDLLKKHDISENIDYLSCDLEPANITFCALTILINQGIFPRIITFEHDFYRYSATNYYKVATDFLNYHGYKIAVDNVTVDDTASQFFETWYVRNNIKIDMLDYQTWKTKPLGKT
jgi:hypothetical protein